ncbi:proton-conducting transporter transmembrane domain-containing protein [Roseococcus thiosulfatophilus]|uniref:proton-conducting transporter transmembrane domain-containing protein n=1 Tax=Roseococcus thiosulfatophilus TaxID=35813 RepID=UPI001A8EA752|nr:proton-conducting transporter membrane subunit [Roseococcus thiosulfatophilus]
MATRADWLLALPLLLPLLACAATAALQSHRDLQRGITAITAVGLLLASAALVAEVISQGVIASQMGDWPAPFGITLVADLFAASMVAITALMYAATALYARGDADVLDNEALWHPLLAALALGVGGAFLAGDLFNLYVWFEVMLIASFGLIVLGGGREQLDGAVKYAMLNLLATTVFLISVGMMFGLTGTLNLADMARRIPEIENQGAVAAVAFLMLAAFGAKAAVFPLFFWLPASYHTAIAPVAAIFAALLTKVGVYALIRIVTLLLPEGHAWVAPLMWFLAAGTMVVGVLGAAAHWEIRRILSFHIISQIGYMIVGIAIATPLALAGAVLYMLHHIVVKANLFLVAGVIRRAGGTFSLATLGGLWRRDPWLGLLFAIPALSLAGIPPLSGFWAKLFVLKSGFDAGWYVLAGIALATGILTLYSMLKIWMEAFWKEVPEGTPELPPITGATRWLLLAPVAGLGLVTITIGLWTEPFAAFALAAGEQLASREAYITAVMGVIRP